MGHPCVKTILISQQPKRIFRSNYRLIIVIIIIHKLINYKKIFSLTRRYDIYTQSWVYKTLGHTKSSQSHITYY